MTRYQWRPDLEEHEVKFERVQEELRLKVKDRDTILSS